MRILRVVSDLYPSVIGGLGIHAHEMSKLQAQKGHIVTVITYKSDFDTDNYNDRNYSVRKVSASVKLFGNSISLSLPFFLNQLEGQFDIVHAHSHLFYSTFICALQRMRGTTPLVITNHGLISQTAPMWLQKIYLPTVAKWIFTSADKIICYTTTDKEQLNKLGIEGEKIVVIHNGICTDTFHPINTPPIKQFLWIGRYTPGKGVKYLIDAFHIFHKDHPEYSLLMVGKGPLKEKIIQQIRNLGLDSSIKLLDFISNAELPSVYQRSYIFILPSLEEGVPRTILEAMSCGVPVICTNLPQLVDIVSGSGILVPVKNSEALADALERIVTDQELKRVFSESGRDRALSEYSWADTVQRTLNLYEDLVT